MEEKNLEMQYPVVCTRGVVVFPNQEISIDVGRTKSMQAVEEAQLHFDNTVVLVAQKDVAMEDPKAEDIFGFGTLCVIKHVRRMEGYLRVKFRGVKRASIHTLINDDTMMSADIELMEDVMRKLLWCAGSLISLKKLILSISICRKR